MFPPLSLHRFSWQPREKERGVVRLPKLTLQALLLTLPASSPPRPNAEHPTVPHRSQKAIPWDPGSPGPTDKDPFRTSI